jgi:hypothetical protein
MSNTVDARDAELGIDRNAGPKPSKRLTLVQTVTKALGAGPAEDVKPSTTAKMIT